MTRGRLTRPLFALVAALVALAWWSTPALGHSELVSSSPAEGESVEGPTTVSLVFNEALIEVGSELAVTDADGVATPLSPTHPQPTTVRAELPELAEGPATVVWRVVSADGHPIEGVLSFTVTGGVQPEPSPSPSPASSPSASPTISIVPISAPEPSGGLPAWLWIALVIAVLAAAGAAMVTSRRR